MIISPARFEDQMREIAKIQEPEELKTQRIINVMIDVLASLGYGAGIRYITTEEER